MDAKKETNNTCYIHCILHRWFDNKIEWWIKEWRQGERNVSIDVEKNIMSKNRNVR